MKMYIEDFIFQQAVTAFSIIRLVTMTTKHSTNLKRTLCGIIFAVSVDILLVILPTNSIVYSSVYLITPFLIVNIVYTCTIKQKLFSFLMYNIFSYSIKGLIVSLASTTFYSSVGLITYTKYSPILIISCILMFTYIYEAVVNSAKLKLKSNSLIYKISIYNGDNKLNTTAFIDTGNMLNIGGKGVVIIDYITFLDLIKTSQSNISPIISLNASTIAESRSIPIYILDKLEISTENGVKTINNVYIGVSQTSIFSNKNYKALISPEMI